VVVIDIDPIYSISLFLCENKESKNISPPKKQFIPHFYHNERLIKYIFRLRMSFLRLNQEPFSLGNWSLTFANLLIGWTFVSLVWWYMVTGLANKKLINMNWSDRRQPINLVFAQNSTFCGHIGVGGIENYTHTHWKQPQIYFCELPLHNWRISYKSRLSFLLLWLYGLAQFECFDSLKKTNCLLQRGLRGYGSW